MGMGSISERVSEEGDEGMRTISERASEEGDRYTQGGGRGADNFSEGSRRSRRRFEDPGGHGYGGGEEAYGSPRNSRSRTSGRSHHPRPGDTLATAFRTSATKLLSFLRFGGGKPDPGSGSGSSPPAEQGPAGAGASSQRDPLPEGADLRIPQHPGSDRSSTLLSATGLAPPPAASAPPDPPSAADAGPDATAATAVAPPPSPPPPPPSKLLLAGRLLQMLRLKRPATAATTSPPPLVTPLILPQTYDAGEQSTSRQSQSASYPPLHPEGSSAGSPGMSTSYPPLQPDGSSAGSTGNQGGGGRRPTCKSRPRPQVFYAMAVSSTTADSSIRT